MFRREDAKLVFLALARLRPRYRSALILREMHGLSSVDIGESLELKPGAVDTLVCRARDAFGREYAELSGLPSECRRAVEYIYRDRGSGIEDWERGWLAEHVSGCPRCARERTLAADPKRLAVLLPLAGIRPEGLGILQRALEALGSGPASFEALGLVTAKVTAVAVAATIAVSPIAGRVGRGEVDRAERASVVAATPSRGHDACAVSVVAPVPAAHAPATASVIASASAVESAVAPALPDVATVVVVPLEPADDADGAMIEESDSGVPPVSASGTGAPDPPGGEVPPSDPPFEVELPDSTGVGEEPGTGADSVTPGAPTDPASGTAEPSIGL